MNEQMHYSRIKDEANTIDEALKIAVQRLKTSVPKAEVYAAHVTWCEDLVWRVELSVAHFSVPHVYELVRPRFK